MDNPIQNPIPNPVQNNKNKIIIIVASLILLSTILIAVIVYFSTKKSGSTEITEPPLVEPSKEISVDLTINGPESISKRVSISTSVLDELTISRFLDRYYNIDNPNLFLISLSINNIDLTDKLLNGRLDPLKGFKKLSDFFNNSYPSAINVKIEYRLECAGTAPDCFGPLTSRGPVCTINGWECRDNVRCADRATLISALNCTDPNKKYPVCNDSNPSYVRTYCDTCPGSPIQCGDFGTSICTATGWSCQPSCPTPERLRQLSATSCTGGKFLTCQIGSDGRTITGCTPCSPVDCSAADRAMTGTYTGPTGTAPVSALCAPVCNGENNICRQGANTNKESVTTCPADRPIVVMPDLTGIDKNTLPLCSTNLTDASLDTRYSAFCKDCSDLPKPVRGQTGYSELCDINNITGACNGYDYVCTATGWSCKPNKATGFRGSFDMKNCCRPFTYRDTNNNIITGIPPSTQASYNTNDKKVICGCGNGYSSCGSSELCCPNGMCQSYPGTSGTEYMCCQSADQVCPSTSLAPLCCESGKKCIKNNGISTGKCGAVCGSNICNENDICVQIDNVTDSGIISYFQNRKNANDKVEITDGPTNQSGKTIRFCKSPQDCLSDDVKVIPSAISNNYFCYPFRTDGGEIGYCKPVVLNSSTNKADKDRCFNNISKSSCSATSGCEWKNIMESINSTGPAGTNTLQNNISTINTDMELLTGNLGQYCTTQGDTLSYSRVLAYQMKNDSCDWKNCFANLAQPGISIIDYNNDTGVCIGIKDCNGSTANMQSNFSSTLTNHPRNINTFGSCNTTVCPSIATSQGSDIICDNNGAVKRVDENLFYPYRRALPTVDNTAVEIESPVYTRENNTSLFSVDALKIFWDLSRYDNSTSGLNGLNAYINRLPTYTIRSANRTLKTINRMVYDYFTNKATFSHGSEDSNLRGGYYTEQSDKVTYSTDILRPIRFRCDLSNTTGYTVNQIATDSPTFTNFSSLTKDNLIGNIYGSNSDARDNCPKISTFGFNTISNMIYDPATLPQNATIYTKEGYTVTQAQKALADLIALQNRGTSIVNYCSTNGFVRIDTNTTLLPINAVVFQNTSPTLAFFVSLSNNPTDTKVRFHSNETTMYTSINIPIPNWIEYKYGNIIGGGGDINYQQQLDNPLIKSFQNLNIQDVMNQIKFECELETQVYAVVTEINYNNSQIKYWKKYSTNIQNPQYFYCIRNNIQDENKTLWVKKSNYQQFVEFRPINEEIIRNTDNRALLYIKNNFNIVIDQSTILNFNKGVIFEIYLSLLNTLNNNQTYINNTVKKFSYINGRICYNEGNNVLCLAPGDNSIFSPLNFEPIQFNKINQLWGITNQNKLINLANNLCLTQDDFGTTGLTYCDNQSSWFSIKTPNTNSKPFCQGSYSNPICEIDGYQYTTFNPTLPQASGSRSCPSDLKELCDKDTRFYIRQKGTNEYLKIIGTTSTNRATQFETISSQPPVGYEYQWVIGLAKSFNPKSNKDGYVLICLKNSAAVFRGNIAWEWWPNVLSQTSIGDNQGDDIFSNSIFILDVIKEPTTGTYTISLQNNPSIKFGQNLEFVPVNTTEPYKKFLPKSTPLFTVNNNVNSYNVSDLSNHILDCGNKALSQVHFNTNTDFNTYYALNYDYLCADNNTLSQNKDTYINKSTNWTTISDNTTSLASHNVDCTEENAYLGKVQLMKDGTKIRYDYTCIPSTQTTQKTSLTTPMNDSGKNYNYSTAFLDRHNISCPDDSHLCQFRLVNNNSDKTQYQYQYTCCKPNCELTENGYICQNNINCNSNNCPTVPSNLYNQYNNFVYDSRCYDYFKIEFSKTFSTLDETIKAFYTLQKLWDKGYKTINSVPYYNGFLKFNTTNSTFDRFNALVIVKRSFVTQPFSATFMTLKPVNNIYYRIPKDIIQETILISNLVITEST